MSIQNKLKENISRGKVAETSGLPGFRERMKTMVREEVMRFKDEIMQELKRTMADILAQDGITIHKGDPGYTPKKGIDYFTKAELDFLKQEITPQKGKHYFDGRPGSQGVPGAPGKPGKDGKHATAKEMASILNTEDEIVEQSTIKGLAQAIQNIQNSLKQRGGGGGGGGMSTPFHQQFTGDGSTTSFTLTYNVAGNSKAILGFVNGQQVSLGTHYTVLGKIISTTFTPAGQPEPDKLEFIYWRK